MTLIPNKKKIQHWLPIQTHSQAVSCVQAAAVWDTQSARSQQKRHSCTLEQCTVKAAWKLCDLRNSTYQWENLHILSCTFHHRWWVTISNRSQGSTSTCFLSPGLFKDGRCFPLRGLYNVTLICFMSVLQQRQAPETWRQSPRWTLVSAKSRMAAPRRRPRARIAGSKHNNIHISWATAETFAVASDVLGRWGWHACYLRHIEDLGV